MARTVKPDAVAAKRREILDATQRLVLTRGYEHMSIQDILNEVKISSGAFHHYFESRQALLEAFIERIKQESEKPLLPIIDDPTLSAIEKFQGFFDTLDRLRVAHKTEVIKLGHIWYTDSNALVRQKVDEAIREQRAPLLTRIVHQGIAEGAFTNDHPEHSGEIILSLLQGMGNTHARLFLLLAEQCNDPDRIAGIVDEIVTTHAAYLDAIERVLGVAPHSFARVDVEAINVWVAAFQANDQA